MALRFLYYREQEAGKGEGDGGKTTVILPCSGQAHCYAENAICCIDNVKTTVKDFQGRSRSIANIFIGCVERSSVCNRP